MALILPPAPIDAPFGSYNWADWYEKVRRLINAVTIISWSQINDFTGSNLNQLQTRSHQSLQNVLGTTVPDTAFGHVPTGGTSTQVLTKLSGTNYDYGWAAAGGGGGTGTVNTVIKGAGWSGLGGVAIITGTTEDYQLVPRFTQAATLTNIEIKTLGGTGSCTIDAFQTTYAGLPATTSIFTTLPSIVGGTKYTDSVLAGVTTAAAAGDELTIRIVSSSTFTHVIVVFTYSVP